MDCRPSWRVRAAASLSVFWPSRVNEDKPDNTDSAVTIFLSSTKTATLTHDFDQEIKVERRYSLRAGKAFGLTTAFGLNHLLLH
mmetsp:Transcript_4263/g.13335  ORF Transcript_4263/g.13335 Transcript_4263/m.13335 type:complete len:84 (-) Transcript_4263:102-353(-)